MSKALPRLTVLSQEQIQGVHSASLEILSSTGIKVHSLPALEIFTKSDGVSVDEDKVFFRPELVDQSIAMAPKSIRIYDRQGQPSFELGTEKDNTIFGVGVTNSHFQNPENEQIDPFARHHVSQATQLGNTLENFSLISTPGVIQDPNMESSEVLASLEMVANTTKPLVLLVSNTGQFMNSLDLLEHLTGDLSSKPFVIPYFNPITPLVLNAETLDKMLVTIQKGLPLIYSSYGMSGATAPITAGGTLALQNAELLAGLVFAQLVNPGTPVILGCLPAVFEMRHMTSAYTPQTMLINLACAEMMNHYQVPHSGTSGSGPGWGPDLPGSGLLWMNHLTSIMGKVGLVPFVGGNFDSLVFSPEMVIYSNEVIRQVRLFSDGMDLSNDSIDLGTIREVGPAGNYLQSDQTLNLFRDIHEQHNRIWPGLSLDDWLGKGSPKAAELLQSHTIEVLSNLIVPADHDELIQKGEAWVAENC